MFKCQLKNSCLSQTESTKEPGVFKGRYKQPKRIKRKASFNPKTNKRLPVITPFVQMSSKLSMAKHKASDTELSDSESEGNTTIKAGKDTPIPNKESGYRLRNHSYQQSVGSLNATNSSTPNVTQGKNHNIVETLDEMGSLEDLLPPKLLLKKEDFDKKNNTNKFDTILDSVNKLYSLHAQVTARTKALETAVFDDQIGVLPQLQGLATHAKDSLDKQETLTKEVIELREELDIAKGLIHKQSKQIKALKSKQVDLIARSMSENLTISGIKGDTNKADTKALLHNFLEENLEIEIEEDEEIQVAHRLGTPSKDHHRPVVFRCPIPLRKKIFGNVQKLAGKQISINQQLPDALAEQKREIRQAIKETKRLEKDKDEQDKSTFLIRNNKLYINGQLKRKVLLPPTPEELFVNSSDRKSLADIKMYTSTRKPAKGCSFQAFALPTERLNDVQMAYKRLFREFPGADHIAAAFNAEGEEGYQDDSEFGSGYRLLNVIREVKLFNTAVFVVRYYGGEHLGQQRFSVMKDLAEEALFNMK